MRSYRKVRVLLLVLLTGGTLLNASCGEIVVQSVKTGLFSVVSGSVTTTLGGTQLNQFLASLFTGSTATSGTGT